MQRQNGQWHAIWPLAIGALCETILFYYSFANEEHVTENPRHWFRFRHDFSGFTFKRKYCVSCSCWYIVADAGAAFELFHFIRCVKIVSTDNGDCLFITFKWLAFSHPYSIHVNLTLKIILPKETIQIRPVNTVATQEQERFPDVRNVLRLDGR